MPPLTPPARSSRCGQWHRQWSQAKGRCLALYRWRCTAKRLGGNVGQSLTSHKVKGSFALLGGCNSLPPAPQNVSGGAKNYLGLAANASQQGGIVPYLLTAIGSGGQFIYVDQSKLTDATDIADILRAQLSHSAGAGRWSDYVSDNPTYLYDRLNSWEYKWIDASTAAGGVNQGVPSPQVSVPLPSQFTYYGVAQNNAYVLYGYLTQGRLLYSSHKTPPNNGLAQQCAVRALGRPLLE